MLSPDAQAHVLGVLIETELAGLPLDIYIPLDAVTDSRDMGYRSFRHLPEALLRVMLTAKERGYYTDDEASEHVLASHTWFHLRNRAAVIRFVAQLEIDRRFP